MQRVLELLSMHTLAVLLTVNKDESQTSVEETNIRQLTRDEGKQPVAKTINTLTEWKISFQGIDICLIVKSHLDRRAVIDNRFKNNSNGCRRRCA